MHTYIWHFTHIPTTMAGTTRMGGRCYPWRWHRPLEKGKPIARRNKSEIIFVGNYQSSGFRIVFSAMAHTNASSNDWSINHGRTETYWDPWGSPAHTVGTYSLIPVIPPALIRAFQAHPASEARAELASAFRKNGNAITRT